MLSHARFYANKSLDLTKKALRNAPKEAIAAAAFALKVASATAQELVVDAARNMSSTGQPGPKPGPNPDDDYLVNKVLVPIAIGAGCVAVGAIIICACVNTCMRVTRGRSERPEQHRNYRKLDNV